MAEYSEYKDSGQQWLGMVPSHWTVDKISAHFQERKAIVSDVDFKPLSVTKNGVVPQLDTAAKSDNGDNRKLVKKGDFVVNSRSDRKGSCGFSELDGSVSVIYIVATPIDVNGRFYHYLFRSNNYVEEFYRNGHGIVADLWTTRYDEMKNIQIPVPPKEEQEAIVAYLDKVTADIDKAIVAKERIIASLEERRKIIITHAVTRGINPDAPMKDSGIDWLGEIPGHWESYPVRHFFEFRNGYTPSKANSSFWTNGTIPWFRMEDIRKSGRFLDNAIQYITPSALNNGGTFEAWSYILAICTASIGEHAMLIADSLANQRFANLKIRKSLSGRTDAMFIFYYLYVLGQYCRDTANTTTFQYADMTQVKNFIVPLPSLDEQKEIVKYLEYNTKGIETAIAQQKRLIELLRERKNIIINETVTGKVKVI